MQTNGGFFNDDATAAMRRQRLEEMRQQQLEKQRQKTASFAAAPVMSRPSLISASSSNASSSSGGATSPTYGATAASAVTAAPSTQFRTTILSQYTLPSSSSFNNSTRPGTATTFANTATLPSRSSFLGTNAAQTTGSPSASSPDGLDEEKLDADVGPSATGAVSSSQYHQSALMMRGGPRRNSLDFRNSSVSYGYGGGGMNGGGGMGMGAAGAGTDPSRRVSNVERDLLAHGIAPVFDPANPHALGGDTPHYPYSGSQTPNYGATPYGVNSAAAAAAAASASVGGVAYATTLADPTAAAAAAASAAAANGLATSGSASAPVSRPSYTPNAGYDQKNGLNSHPSLQPLLPRTNDPPTMRAFLHRPCPRHMPLQFYITRGKRSLTNAMSPTYSLYLEGTEMFLMASRKRSKNKTSNYMMSLDPKEVGKDSEKGSRNYLGKVRSNFLGTEFVVYDSGSNPSKLSKADCQEAARLELGAVFYESNVFGSRGPRRMTVLVPAIQTNGAPVEWRPQSENDGMIAAFRRESNISTLLSLQNKSPKWNDAVNAYVLNFNGRVTMASVKNFQLCLPEDPETTVLQFGRTGKDSFTMDVQWPLSPLQAFAICLASFDYKIACE